MVLILVLSLTREGSVATLLAEKMSHREKIFVTALVLGFVFAVSVYDEEAEKQPFDLPQALVATADGVSVKVSIGGSTDEQTGQQLAELVAQQTAEMKQFLQLQKVPPVFVVQRRDLDGDRFERGVLDGAEGLLVRANFLADDWHEGRFLSWLLRELLVVASDQRLKLEQNMWLLDGFALYWVCRDENAERADYAQLELRASYGAQQGFTATDLEDWLSYRERVGADIAAAVAWSGLVSLARSAGHERCRALLKSMLDCDAPSDLRSVLRQWREPLPVVFQREVGLAYGKFLSNWSDELLASTEARADELTAIPEARGALEFVPVSAATRAVAYQFHCDPPPIRGQFTLLHAELPPFDHEVPVPELRREELNYGRDQKGELPGTFARGTRLYSTFSIWVERLGCEVITGWTRREMH
jgi:hypothetical protein